MKMINAFPTWLNGAIFKVLTDNYDVPWKTLVDGTTLDLQYFGNHSGQKTISPLLSSLLLNGVLYDSAIDSLALVIFRMFYIQWDKIYTTMNLDYNPINNYDMKETYEESRANTGTVQNIDSTIYGKTIANDGTNTSINNASIYGFNSSDSVNADKNIQDNTTNVTETQGGTDSNNATRTDNLQESNTHTLERSGNIGVTTSQQMIEAERRLWQFNYFDTVFKDVDTILTIPYYESEE